MAHPHGLFTWADVSVPDTSAAKAFYAQIFGWEAEETEQYTLFRKGGKLAAGMGELTEERKQAGERPSWTSYVNVDDVDTVAKQATELGGTVVMQPMDVMDAGRMAVVLDPTGCILALWQPMNHSGADAYNDPGFLTWNELPTSDPKKAADFYAGLLGWQINVEEFDGFTYRTILVDGKPNGGIYAQGETPAAWLAWFRVADTDVTVARIVELGGSVLREPQDTPFGRSAVVADPQGAMFAIIGPGPQSG